jgi:hypothetical protein
MKCYYQNDTKCLYLVAYTSLRVTADSRLIIKGMHTNKPLTFFKTVESLLFYYYVELVTLVQPCTLRFLRCYVTNSYISGMVTLSGIR